MSKKTEMGVMLASRFEPGSTAYLHRRQGGAYDADTAGASLAEAKVDKGGSVVFTKIGDEELGEGGRYWITGKAFDGRLEGVAVTVKEVMDPEEMRSRLEATRPVDDGTEVIVGPRNTRSARPKAKGVLVGAVGATREQEGVGDVPGAIAEGEAMSSVPGANHEAQLRVEEDPEDDEEKDDESKPRRRRKASPKQS